MTKQVVSSMFVMQFIAVILKLSGVLSWSWLAVFLPTLIVMSMLGALLLYLDHCHGYVRNVILSLREMEKDLAKIREVIHDK